MRVSFAFAAPRRTLLMEVPVPAYSALDLWNAAARHVGEGHRLQSEHQAEETGCCRSCGRVVPCDEATRGHLLIDHFGAFLDQPVLDRLSPGSQSDASHGVGLRPSAA